MKTSVRDSYYTSDAFAEVLTGFIDFTKVHTVADVCVGGGNLLRAAQKRKGDLLCFGTDISSDVIDKLCVQHSDWILGTCDFLDTESRNKTFLCGRSFDLILLNPPFTCKGSVIRVIFYKGEEFHVSTSMAFLVNVLQYIKPQGEIFAIMPISTIYSQKDRKIWSEICNDFRVVVHQESEHEFFGECAPNVVIISIRRGETKGPIFNQPRLYVSMEIEVVRGTKNMHYMSQRAGDVQLIHTTSLQRNKIVEDLHVSSDVWRVKGPGVLIPRVGLPKNDKICLMPSNKKCAISDCIILLRTKTVRESKLLKQLILDDWDNFSSLYKGTGAKYITIERVKNYFGIASGV